MRERFPEKLVAIGFSWHKKTLVRRFFQGSEVIFKTKLHVTTEQDKAALLVWQRPRLKEATPGQVLAIEDGFIRSVGLGAELVAPLSWAIDRRGMYYDSRSVSDLEHILQHTDFTAKLLLRAEQLRHRLVAEGVTKYNVGAGQWLRESSREVGQARVILVPGQVESDASLRFGAPVLTSNSDLLQAVRLANPEAYVLYKPHPDVMAGLRKQGENDAQAHQWCNEVLSDVAMGHLLTQVDEVHTLTSLTGFEALLRDKKVVCYGQPFYSGWGLTEDKVGLARRTRTLSINALVAGVLILYPVYVSRSTGRYTSPERALDELMAWQQEAKLPRWCQVVFRYVLTVEKKLTRNAA
jgi:capsular polysaccharide export protein